MTKNTLGSGYAFLPPNALQSAKLPLTQLSGDFYRIARNDLGIYSPLHFGRVPKSRFDDPKRKYGVLYLAGTVDGAFAEVFIRNPVPGVSPKLIDKLMLSRSLVKVR